MDKWLKTGSLKRAVTSPEIQHTNLAVASTSKQCNDSESHGNQGATIDGSVKTQNYNAPSKKRKYSNEYLKYGFSFTGDEDCVKPLCVVCGEILSNGSMKPSLLIRHLETKHPTYKQKDISFFQRILNSPNVTSCFLSTKKVNEDATEASYRISYWIAKRGKNHTIGEDLIKPCIKDAVQCMLGEDYVRKINNIPLSNNTVVRRIKDMSDDIESTVITRIQKSPYFSIQVDESTDVSNLSILLVIARYLNDNAVEENLLLCYPLTERCKGEDIFNAIQDYFHEKKIDWVNCCGVCTDGGKSMSGCYKGLRGRIKEVDPQAQVVWTHCCIHRQSLATKPLPDSLKKVLNQSVKVINFIKANSTNSRLFKSLCEKMDSLHTTLLLHTEVRWLSRGKILTRLFELRHEVQVFFEDHSFELASVFHENEWLQQLAYLSDIFSEINKLNLGLQDSSITIFKVHDKIDSMIKKLDFWITCVEKDQCEVFETLRSFLSENELKLPKGVKTSIIAHLKGLRVSFRQYFPERNVEHNWISNPFNEIFFKQAENLSVFEKQKLIELSSDSSLQYYFQRRNLIDFWAETRKEYQELSDNAIKYLLPFTNTESVERAFSSYAFIKNKHRNKLDAVPDLRLYLSSIEPDFKTLSSMKQAQGSH